MRKAVLAAAVSAMVAGAGGASAQEWPTRPVTLVVPYAAGGPADVMARIISQRLSEILGR
jgi:tripartite-type tricarboxylate transporter receptor subunit TctC